MTPFPHWIKDGLFPAETLRAILAEWPSSKEMNFKVCSTSVKAHCTDPSKFGPTTKAFFERLNSSAFVSYLEELTGIEGLIPDPEMRGGGLHEIPPGGFLNMHVDFNWHKRLGAARKLNLLLYLNEDWKWNGDLILSTDGTQISKVIQPLFGRCVVFETSDTSWHGHPEPLTAPRSRKSIALYYYRKEDRPMVHSTIYA